MHAYSVRINPARRRDPLWRAVDPENGADFVKDMVVFAKSPEDARRYLDATFLATGFLPRQAAPAGHRIAVARTRPGPHRARAGP